MSQIIHQTVYFYYACLSRQPYLVLNSKSGKLAYICYSYVYNYR